MVRIGYFGGSFDPPHRGHLALARAAQETFALDRVLFVPTGFQPLKPDGATASFEDRLAMVSLLCERKPGFEVSRLEAPRLDGQPNFTIDALTELRSKTGVGDSLFILVGADAFLGLHQWRAPEQLLAAADWIVLARPGFPESDIDRLELTSQRRSRVHVLNGVDDPVSATDVRLRLLEGADCSELLPAAVLAYIREHHLYSGD